jgi:TolB-like protein
VPDAAPDRLDSWKEIAAYLHRGVRTVRRWETDEGLPVHRHVHRTLGSVYAYRSEIDTWRQSRIDGHGPRTAVDVRRGSAGSGPTNSIAVLPFVNLSADPDNAYFADGLTEVVIVDLAALRSLRVISRTSSMTFKDTKKDVRTIARELDVRYVLQGSVRCAGGQLRIAAQLIDAATDDHLWTETYDGTLEDIFTIQERLARLIVAALELRLTAMNSGASGNAPSATCTRMSVISGRGMKRGAGGAMRSITPSSCCRTGSRLSVTTRHSTVRSATRISSIGKPESTSATGRSTKQRSAHIRSCRSSRAPRRDSGCAAGSNMRAG